MRMTYNRYQVMAAAQYIWNYNDAVQRWPSQPRSALDVVEDILAFGRKHGTRNMQRPDSEWTSWSGTGGYMVLFTSDDNDSFNIDVYVDASVGLEGRYVEEFIDEDEGEQ